MNLSQDSASLYSWSLPGSSGDAGNPHLVVSCRCCQKFHRRQHLHILQLFTDICSRKKPFQRRHVPRGLHLPCSAGPPGRNSEPRNGAAGDGSCPGRGGRSGDYMYEILQRRIVMCNNWYVLQIFNFMMQSLLWLFLLLIWFTSSSCMKSVMRVTFIYMVRGQWISIFNQVL